MAINYPNGGLITETNANYYAGQQTFIIPTHVNSNLVCTFETKLIGGTTPLNNFSVYSVSGTVLTLLTEGVDYDLSTTTDNVIELTAVPTSGDVFLVQLSQPAIENNYGEYEYISLREVISNFLVAYVGNDKLIKNVKRTDVMFHAKRGLQEFSYDTLRSIKSQEISMPPNLAIPIPQDYVNYVRLSWIDNAGVRRIIYPNPIVTDPTEVPLQDNKGQYIQDAFPGIESNLQAAQSKIEERWKKFNDQDIIGNWNLDQLGVYNWQYWKVFYGERYGLNPQLSQQNGWFTINGRTNMFNFSSNLSGQLILLEYISDGLAYDEDTKVPKMAEQAMYMHIAHGILSTRSNVPEYIVARFKKDRSAALRNAKIRLQNLKLEEMAQVMRNKSKWIKH